MSKIEDRPELKWAFAKIANDFGLSDHEFFRGIAEHFFIAGRESAFEETKETIYRHGIKEIEQTRQMSKKPKRTIEHVYSNDKAVFVLTNDKKVFALRVTDVGFQWVKQPDLPQED